MTDVSTTCAEVQYNPVLYMGCNIIHNLCGSQVTLKMASAQVVETSVTNNSPSQDSYHPDDLFQSRYATPGFKPFS